MPRIIISPTQFKLSKAGYDAATTGTDNLLFDGFSDRKYNGIYLSGIAYNSGGWPSYQIGNVFLGQVQHTRRYYDVGFGKTFAQRPQVLLAMRPTGDTGWGAAPKYAHVQSQTNGLVGTCVTAACTTTYLRITVDNPTFGTGSGNVNWDVSYVVFQT
jgi:hypothetical protein